MSCVDDAHVLGIQKLLLDIPLTDRQIPGDRVKTANSLRSFVEELETNDGTEDENV